MITSLSCAVRLVAQLDETKKSVSVKHITLTDTNCKTVCFNSLTNLFEYCIQENIKNLYFHDFDIESTYLVNYFENVLHLRMMMDYPKTTDKNVYNVFKLDKVYSIIAKFNNCYFKLLSSKNIFMSKLTKIYSSYCGGKIKLKDDIALLNYDEYISDDIINHDKTATIAVAMALRSWVGAGYNEITVGSQSLKLWQKSFKNYEEVFPTLSLDLDERLRLGYRGGFTWGKDSKMNKLIGDGIVADANAMYSSIMTQYNMPCGIPVWHPGKPDISELPGSKLFVTIVRVTAICKNYNVDTHEYDDNIPAIPCISFTKTGGLVNKTEVQPYLVDAQLTLTNYDLASLFDNYMTTNGQSLKNNDCFVQFIGYWEFNSCRGAFDNYLIKCYNKKINSQGAVRELNKLMYEALSGKLGTRHDKKRDVLDVSNGKVIYTDKVETSQTKTRKSWSYLPVIMFTTSIARYNIINWGLLYWDRLIYIDTDGLHLEGLEWPEGLPQGSQLGQYKLECTFSKALYIGLKTYIHQEDDKTVVKMAGAPEAAQEMITWDNFKSGTVLKTVKPMTVHVIGGSYRKYTDYTI